MNYLTKFLQLADTTASTTAANGGTGATGGWAAMLLQLVPFALIIVVFYFLLIRPQKKRQKEEQQMRSNLRVGDELVTIGGICGRVVSLKDDTVTIESGADRTKIVFQKSAIQTVLTKHDDPAPDDDDDDDDI